MQKIMIESLRNATRELHEEIEKENIASKIMDHSISLEDYKLLLLQNYIAYRSAETEIRKFSDAGNSQKHKNLEKDLKGLGLNLPDFFNFEKTFSCNNEIEAIGAAYVVEGSALGGMMIAKELENCPELQSIPKQQFFSADRAATKGWNNFLKLLRNSRFTENEKEEASNKAKETFLLFKSAFGVNQIS